MNNKGQLMMVGLMIAVFVFITAVVFMTPIKDMIEMNRNASNLDCANTSITTGTKLTCIIVDLYLPYFIGVVIFAGIAIIRARRASGG